MPKSKFTRVKLKVYEVANAAENKKFLFPFFTKCTFLNDGGKLRFSEVV